MPRACARMWSFPQRTPRAATRHFLAKAFSVAVKAGATVINAPDTVGYATPQEMFEMIDYLAKHVEGVENVDISTHRHDDPGLAVANSPGSGKGRGHAGGMHHQRHWRARGQCQLRGDCDGHKDPPRFLRDGLQHRHKTDLQDLQAALLHHGRAHCAQQGHQGPTRLRMNPACTSTG